MRSSLLEYLTGALVLVATTAARLPPARRGRPTFGSVFFCIAGEQHLAQFAPLGKNALEFVDLRLQGVLKLLVVFGMLHRAAAALPILGCTLGIGNTWCEFEIVGLIERERRWGDHDL